MCFEPVDLSFRNRTILQPNRGFALDFAPVAAAVEADQSREDSNPSASRDSLGLSNLAQNLESHSAQDTAREEPVGLTASA